MGLPAAIGDDPQLKKGGHSCQELADTWPELGIVAYASTAEQCVLHERQSSLLYQTRCQGLILITDTDSRTCVLIGVQQGEV